MSVFLLTLKSMEYNFDQKIERRGTDCVKWDMLKPLYGRDDLQPMWVADMDWPSPDFVINALRNRLEHPVLGYAMASENYHNAVINWLASHYNINATKDELHFIPGIVAGIAYALLCLTEPGDKVLVTTPVYPPFLHLPAESKRELVCSKLKIVDGRFAIDFDDFERRAKGCKMLILSNPHNPAGTVWGRDTLVRIAEICERNGMLVISDEIHADMTLPPHSHTSYSTVSEAAASHSLTFMAPSKTFNIAGLGSSTCYVANPSMRKLFFGWLDGLGVAGGNIFAFVGAEAAFAHGEQWRCQMLQYLQGNIATLQQLLGQHLPRVKAVLPEASYLAWLDFSDYGISHEELATLLTDKARLALNDGTTFGGDDYRCCFRMNIGCPRADMKAAIEKMAAALDNHA